MENDFISNAKKITAELSSYGTEIVAATKTRSLSDIAKLVEQTSISTLGENRVQEFISKYDDRYSWDFIGQLQTNKVKYIVDKVRLIHSVDRLSLLQTIEKEAEKRDLAVNILIQVNTAKEESKGGLFLEEAGAFAEEIKGCTHIILKGLMAVAPIHYDKKRLEECFNASHKVFLSLKESFLGVQYLSMGMSNDYRLAVDCGANLVRIGRAIFGERTY